MLSAIRLVAAGESLLAPSVTKRLIEACVSQPEQGTITGRDGLDRVQLVVIAYQAGLVSP